MAIKTKTLISLVTGTCSSDAVKQYKHQLEKESSISIEVMAVNSFYEGKQYLSKKKDPTIVMLIPHVHELCAYLTIHKDYEALVESAFFKPNPPLFLAKSKTEGNPATEKRCAAIEALKTLIPGYKNDMLKFYPVHNTQEAAESVKNGESGYCVTNEYGIKNYGLIEVERLKKMKIYWIPFHWLGVNKL